jgi:LmbE family N-acetylglucosaminyl deacetylase
MKRLTRVRKFFYSFLSVLLLTSLLPFPYLTKAQNNTKHDVELWNTLKPLSTTVTFLNTGAHPDDERSDLLAYLSRGLGVKTSSLIANRGEGGQNEIGNELGNALGIIRSNEMIEASKITGVQVYHLSKTTSDPIYDFGFSKSPEETLEKWGEQLTYERLIRFIRTFKPDIVMPSFRNVDSQHGHHRAITILSERAFHAAADPSVFPEHLEEGLDVWQVKKLYLPAESEEKATTSIEIGHFDPIYGMTYPQLGEKSRSLHKSQGMGRDIPAEPRQFHLELVKSSVNTDQNNLFAGIPYDFNEWAQLITDKNLSTQLKQLQIYLNSLIELYPDRDKIFPVSQKVLKNVQQLINKVKKSNLETSIKNDLLHKLEIKSEQLQVVSFISSNLQVETTINSYVLTPGEEATVTIKIKNNGKHKIHHLQISLLTPTNWELETKKQIKHLKPNESRTVTLRVKVPTDADYFDPYKESVIKTKVSFKENGAQTLAVIDFKETIAVLPKLSLTLDPENIIVNTAKVQKEIPVTVKVKNYDNGQNSAVISLNVPEEWNVEPVQTEVNFKERFEEKEITFKLLPPPHVKEGEFIIHAIAESQGKRYDTTVQEISYDHIKNSYYLYPSNVNGVAFELLMADHLKIGYIESGFDKIADYLINVGFDVDKLSEDDLSSGDLSKYDTIVTGIRANLSREDLVQYNGRLLEYVANGGHLVVQYHKPGDNWDIFKTPPYPIEIGSPSIRWRVTDENAKVTITQPDHKLFNYPNKITEKDWENWVQERGLYFPMNWDERYETFVSMADPNEEPFTSGILMAKYGEGTYLYTNLVFYRQIDNQVPGGYRIFTNLISYSVN